MALTIDSRAVFRAIAEHPEAFPAIQADMDEIARKLLGKQLKAKATDVALLRIVHKCVGDANMSTMLDGFAATELSGLAKKIDPHGPHVGATSDPRGVRSHIVDLATGRVMPSPKPEKTVKATTPKARKATPPKIGGILESKVHGGVKAKASRSKKTG